MRSRRPHQDAKQGATRDAKFCGICILSSHTRYAVCAALAKELDLRYSKIGDIGAEKLAGALPNLTNLKETWLGSLSLSVGF